MRFSSVTVVAPFGVNLSPPPELSFAPRSCSSSCRRPHGELWRSLPGRACPPVQLLFSRSVVRVPPRQPRPQAEHSNGPIDKHCMLKTGRSDRTSSLSRTDRRYRPPSTGGVTTGSDPTAGSLSGACLDEGWQRAGPRAVITTRRGSHSCPAPRAFSSWELRAPDAKGDDLGRVGRPTAHRGSGSSCTVRPPSGRKRVERITREHGLPGAHLRRGWKGGTRQHPERPDARRPSGRARRGTASGRRRVPAA